MTHFYCTLFEKILIMVEIISFLISFTMWLVTGIVTELSSGNILSHYNISSKKERKELVCTRFN